MYNDKTMEKIADSETIHYSDDLIEGLYSRLRMSKLINFCKYMLAANVMCSVEVQFFYGRLSSIGNFINYL